MSAPPIDAPYSGTIVIPDTYKGGPTVKLAKEFFEIPNRNTSKIIVIVKASSGAEIVLYDQAHTEQWTLKVALGSDKNTTSSLGLYANRDPVIDRAYPTHTIKSTGILSANHYKAFAIVWRYGLVQVFNDGEDTPLLSWNGPEDLRIARFGVRSFGASASWQVQGGDEFATAEVNDIGGLFQHFKVNTGRLEFAIKGKQDAYLVLSPTTSDEKAPGLLHFVIGGWGGNRNAIWKNIGEVANYAQVDTLSRYAFRTFWAEYDSTSARFGVQGDDTPKMHYKFPKPIEDLQYFGLISGYGNTIYWRILDVGHRSGVRATPGPAPTPDPQPVFEIRDV